MIRFKKDETPAATTPVVTKSDAATVPANAVSATKAQRPKTPKTKEDASKSAELFLPVEERDAE